MKALLLLAFGGPGSLEEVEPFLIRLFRGRDPSAQQIERVKERYALIGGSSPLREITGAQAKALERRLNRAKVAFMSYVGMRYGHPLIEEALKEILRDGIHEIVALPMVPFRSRESTGAYIDEVKRVLKEIGNGLDISFVEGWHCHHLFIEAIREKIVEALSEFRPGSRERVHLLFTAHSLPRAVVEQDPYVGDMEESVRKVREGMEALSNLPWSIAFQSKGRSSEEWIGPEVESVLTGLSGRGIREVLVIPIGFVSDHIEILYDIDILFQKKAESLGMVLKRTRSLNTSELFIEALAQAVEERMGRERS